MRKSPYDSDDQVHANAGMMRWLMTYADLITLLLAFFIILYAMSRTQAVQFAQTAHALAQQFDTSPRQSTGSQPGYGLESSTSLDHLQQELQRRIDQAHLASQVSVNTTVRGVEVSVNASLLFPSGSARVSSRAQVLLVQLGEILRTVPNAIEVAGYTDATPIRTARYPSNWQLSAQRAANVVYVLAQVPQMHASRLSIAAFGHYHPIATNQTATGRQLNRRVNLLVLRTTVARVVIGHGP